LVFICNSCKAKYFAHDIVNIIKKSSFNSDDEFSLSAIFDEQSELSRQHQEQQHYYDAKDDICTLKQEELLSRSDVDCAGSENLAEDGIGVLSEKHKLFAQTTKNALEMIRDLDVAMDELTDSIRNFASLSESPKKIILILGMFYCNQEIARIGWESVGDTLPACVRDRARILELELLLENSKVYSVGDHDEEGGEPDLDGPVKGKSRHINLRWPDARAFRSKDERLRQSANVVYADYIRFPSAYMRQAYNDKFFETFCPMLYVTGAVSPEAEIIVPNWKVDSTFDFPLNIICKNFYIYPITDPNQYPLYVATQNVWKFSPECLGGCSNLEDMNKLNSEIPFYALKANDIFLASLPERLREWNARRRE
jgi:hypothetical protein